MLYAITTQGDDVEVHDTAAKIVPLLATVDTPAEAWLVAMTASDVGAFACDSPEFAAYRNEGSSFVLRARNYTRTCRPLELTETLYQISAAGQVTESASRIVKSDQEACTSD